MTVRSTDTSLGPVCRSWPKERSNHGPRADRSSLSLLSPLLVSAKELRSQDLSFSSPLPKCRHGGAITNLPAKSRGLCRCMQSSPEGYLPSPFTGGARRVLVRSYKRGYRFPNVDETIRLRASFCPLVVQFSIRPFFCSAVRQQDAIPQKQRYSLSSGLWVISQLDPASP